MGESLPLASRRTIVTLQGDLGATQNTGSRVGTRAWADDSLANRYAVLECGSVGRAFQLSVRPYSDALANGVLNTMAISGQ